MSQSFDSSRRAFAAHHRYESANPNDSEYDLSQSRGYTATPAKRGPNKWLKIGIPVIVVAVIGIILGIVLSTRHKSSTSNNTSTPSSTTGGNKGGGGGGNNLLGVFFTGTDGYGLPVYPSTVRYYVFIPQQSNLLQI